MLNRDILEDQIKTWADRYDASGRLPELIRRLLFATATLREVSMGAGQGTWLPGFDGYVDADSPGPYCPAGISVWELSTENNAPSKIKEDFKKRLAETKTEGGAAGMWTYMAVTARLLRDKKGLEAELRRENTIFRDVRVLDASDLAAWLSQAPAVEQWFASSILGLSANDLEALESALEAFSKRSQPSLPWTILCEGRARMEQAGAVRRWVQGSPTHLYIQGESLDEAAHFAAAALAMDPDESARNKLLNRTLMVHSQEALLGIQHIARQYGLTLIANTGIERNTLSRLPKDLRIVVPCKPDDRLNQDTIKLEAIPWSRLPSLLVDAGVPSRDAEQFAFESKGKLSALQRLLGYREKPPWARLEDAEMLAALMLLGSFDASNPEDRRAVGRLAGSADLAEQTCERLSRSEQSPIRKEVSRRGSLWTWVSREDAFQQLGGWISEGLLGRFQAVCKEIFRVDDPVWIKLDKDQRVGANLILQTPRVSEALQHGLAWALARLAQPDANEMLKERLGAESCSNLAAEVVGEVLGNRGSNVAGPPLWVRWASLSEVLPLLAEASPRLFLNRFLKQIDDEQGPARLFGEESVLGPKPHTGLLWALERLAWFPEHLPDVALCLARLHEKDRAIKKQANIANRPLESLVSIFSPARPQTDADPYTCEQVLREILHRVPEIASDLVGRLMELFGIPGGSITLWTGDEPELRSHRRLSDEEWKQRSDNERTQRSTAILKVSVEWAGNAGEKWAKLLPKGSNVLPHIVQELWNRQDIDDSAGHHLWRNLREQCHLYTPHPGRQKPYLPTLELNRLLELYQRYTPKEDLIAQYAWLFSDAILMWPDGTDSLEEEDKPEQERQTALILIWEHPKREQLLLELIDKVPETVVLAESLAKTPHGNDAALYLRPYIAQDKVRRVFANLMGDLLAHDSDRLKQELQTLVAESRLDLAVDILIAIPESMPRGELWKLLDEIGEPLVSSYWSKRSLLRGRYSEDIYVQALERMRTARNTRGAVETLLWSARHIPAENLLPWAEWLVSAEEAAQLLKELPQAAFGLALILDRLGADASLPEDRVAPLEFQLILRLGQQGRGQEFASVKHLSKFFAKQPEQFIALLKDLYRAEGEPEPSSSASETEERRRRAELAFYFLWNWRGYPGDWLPANEAEQELERWAREVLRLAAAERRLKVAEQELARVLSRGPIGPDGRWPCKTARILLAEARDNNLADGLVTAKRNSRGVTGRSVGAGGELERTEARRYREQADAMRKDWFATARMLDELALRYEWQAIQEDQVGENTRQNLGLEIETAASVESPRSPSETSKGSNGTTADIRGGLLHFSKIHIKNLRCFDELIIHELGTASQDGGQDLIILGENGTGKTTLLRALALALLDQQSAAEGLGAMVEPFSLLRDPNQHGVIEVHLGNEVYKAELRSDSERLMVESSGPVLRPWVVGYGCFRGSVLRGSEYSKALQGHTSTLWGETLGLWPGLIWLRDLGSRIRDSDAQAQRVLKATQQMLRTTLHDVDDIRVSAERIYLQGKQWGREVLAEALSDGYLGTMGWLLDMVARWEARLRRLKRPIGEDFIEQMEGIALVDDIDLHLHPVWQRELLPRLRKAFPRMTFVGTTHNPQALVGLERGEKIQVLRHSDEEPSRIEAKALDVPRGRRADQVLTEGWFGLDSTLDEDTLKLVREHQNLLLQGKTSRDPEVQTLEDKLSSLLGRYVSSSYESFVYGIVLEILKESLPNATPDQRMREREKLKALAKKRLEQREGKAP